MRWNILKYLQPTHALRQRSVHVLYLVFLILLFSFIPQNRWTLERTNDHRVAVAQWNLDQSKAQAMLFLQLLDPASDVYNNLKFDLLSFEKWSKQSLDYIQQLTQGIDAGKSVNEKQSSALFSVLQRYRDELTKGEHGLDMEWVDGLLPVSRYVKNPSGKLQEFHRFWFGKRSKEEQLNYLQTLRERVMQLQAMANQHAIQHRAEAYTELNRLLVNSTATLSYGALYDSESFGSILLENGSQFTERIRQMDQLKVSVRSQRDLVLGEAIVLEVTEERNRKVTVRVAGPGGTEIFTLLKAGPFLYFPHQAGLYHVSLSTDEGRIQEQFKVRRAQTPMDVQQDMLLEPGSERVFRLPDALSGESAELLIQSRNLRVDQRGSELRIAAEQAGEAQLHVMARMAYGDIEVFDRRFKVRSPGLYGLELSGRPGSSGISRAELDGNLSLAVSNMASCRILGFQMSLISSRPGTSTATLSNPGASFGPKALELLRSANAGDRILIDGVRANDELGRSVGIAPGVFHIL